jgi:meromycolic acid enoyl-[acyl-carrier-protein] reductase
VNLVAAGPIKTWRPSRSPASPKFEDAWDERAPLGWDVNDPDAVARPCVALLSDWFPKTTGEIVHVDGGYHAIGA